MAFIDFPNITSGGGAYGTLRLDFTGLAEVLTKGTRPVGIMAYVVDRGARQGLFREINRCGLKAEAVSPGKSIDGRLIFDLMVGAQRDFYDIGILASGDRDFVPVVQEVKKLRKEIWVASFSNSIAPSLKACADKFIDLDQHIKSILRKRKLFPANCADCGIAFQLPFEPIKGRSFYCTKCLPKHRK